MTPAEVSQEGVMAGAGYYAHHSATQAKGAELGLAAMAQAIDGLELAPGSTVRVADLGAAQGHNSLAALRLVLERLDGAGHTFEVFHTDLPGNDWATLFQAIEHDPNSYLSGRADAYPAAIGRSFYDRLLPDRTLHLGWTSSTLHWLSGDAGPIPDHFFAPMSNDDAARDRYRRRSADDWRRFLAHRARELAPTGAIVFVDVLMGDDGSMGSEALFDSLEAALRSARDRGDLTEEQYAATVYPSWFRTLDEHQAPFRVGSAEEGERPLVLEALDPVVLADPLWPAYERDGDALAYGRAQAGFLRGFLEPSFLSAWEPSEGAGALVDVVFDECAERVAADPAAVSPAYRLVVGRVSAGS